MSEDVTIRAARAKQLLEDEVMMEAFSGCSHDAAMRVLAADLKNPCDCIAAVAEAKATANFEMKLREFITAGQSAVRKPFVVA
jgi:pyruvate carboxylase